MFLTPARIKDKHVSNFGSKQWMNSKVGLIKVKALAKPQRNNAVNCQASEIDPEIYGDSIATLHFFTNFVYSASGLLLYSVCVQLGEY